MWMIGDKTEHGTFNPSQIYTADAEHCAICQVYGIPLHTRLEDLDLVRYAEPLALARLIAQAPAMLDALKWYVDNDDTDDDPQNQTWINGRQRAKAIIAAAEGK